MLGLAIVLRHYITESYDTHESQVVWTLVMLSSLGAHGPIHPIICLYKFKKIRKGFAELFLKNQVGTGENQVATNQVAVHFRVNPEEAEAIIQQIWNQHVVQR